MATNEDEVKRAALRELARRELARREAARATSEPKTEEQKPMSRTEAFFHMLGQGASYGFTDELAAGMRFAEERDLPLAQQSQNAFDLMEEQLAHSRGQLNRARTQHPGISVAGELAGSVIGGGGLSGVMKSPTTVGGSIARGAGLGAATSAAYGLGTGEGAQDKLIKAATGGATGAVTGALIGGASGAIAARMKPAGVSTEELFDQSQAAYRAVKEAGVSVKNEAVSDAIESIRSAVKGEGFHAGLHPRLNTALSSLDDIAKEPNVSFPELEIQRRILKNAAASLQPDERRVASVAIEKLDDFVNGLKSTDIAGGDSDRAIFAIQQARSLWSRASKSDVIDNLIERARVKAGTNFSMAGYEHAIRNEFKALALSPQRLRGFTEAEVAAIKQVATGGPIDKAMRLLGKLAIRGPVSGAASVGLGALVGGPYGATTVPIVGEIARQGATASTMRNAQLASELIRTGKVIPMPPSPLADFLNIGIAQQAAQPEEQYRRLSEALKR